MTGNRREKDGAGPLNPGLRPDFIPIHGGSMFLGFASDNTAGAHPRILDAVFRANQGYCRPYGFDEYSIRAEAMFRELFDADVEAFFALSGTGCNVLCLRPMLRPWQGVICSDVAHIQTDESGAPEWVAGSKLLTVPSHNGKIVPQALDIYVPDLEDCHHSTPHVLSITQSTEKGAVYSREEILALTSKAHELGLLVHMDGTRLANAVAALEGGGRDALATLRAITRDAGVDVLSFGGSKNGLMLAEAVVFFRPELAADFRTMRKQSLQLVSKMRFVAAQFIEALEGGNDALWFQNARHANAMAQRLADGLSALPHIRVRKPEANAVFACMSPEHIARLQQDFYFYEVDQSIHEVRLMCNFGTTDQEINDFVNAARALA